MSFQNLDKNRCWTTLKYTKPQQFKITLVLKESLENVAISIKDKEARIQKTAFP